MNRIAGSFTLLLAGLGGCVSFTAPPGQGEVKHTTAQVRPFVGQPASSGPLQPPANVPAATPPAPVPASPSWTMAPEHQAPQRPVVDNTPSRSLPPPAPSTLMPGMTPAPLPGAAATPPSSAP